MKKESGWFASRRAAILSLAWFTAMRHSSTGHGESSTSLLKSVASLSRFWGVSSERLARSVKAYAASSQASPCVRSSVSKTAANLSPSKP